MVQQETRAQQETDSGQMNEEQVIYVSIGIVIVILISSVVIWGIGLFQQQQAASYQNKIAGVETEVAELEVIEEKALALGVQEERLDSLYSTQTEWSDLVKDLGTKAVKGVKFIQVTVDKVEQQVTIDGKSNTYLNLNRQVVALQESKFFDQLNIASAQVDDQGDIQFQITGILTN